MANNQSVRRHLDAFTRGRIIGKLEEGRSVTSVAAEFGIAHSIVSRLWRQFQTTGTAIRGYLEALWQTLGSSYLTTSNDSGASIGAARRMGSNASTTNSLTPSFSAWADAVKPA
ncbi:hypothetical protein TNCV_2005331 [Trichonephila clavipes]|nr:hypothetical protein TNCV_2005331 [Trichonephila clavipes]